MLIPRTLAPLLAIACASTGDTATSVVRDSSGIQIVENSQPRWGDRAQLTLSATPTLVIGVQDGQAYQLSRVRDAVRLSDGRIVIADGGSTQLRFYDSTGLFLHAAGRLGRGPEEFRGLSFLRRIRGDTLIAGEDSDVFVFTGEGAFVRRAAGKRSWVKLPTGGGIGAIAWFTSERAVVATVEWWRRSTKPIGGRDTVPISLAIFDRDSAASPFIGTFMHSETGVTDRGSGERASLPRWYSPVFLIANDAERLLVAYGNEYSIRVFSAQGNLSRIIRRSWTPYLVTGADVDRKVAKRLHDWGAAPPATLQQWEHFLRLEPVADTLAAFSQMIVDEAGRLWVRDAQVVDEVGAAWIAGMPQEGSRWSVFDHDGLWLGVVNMPRLFWPRQIGDNYVLGVSQSDDGVETVARYGLLAPR